MTTESVAPASSADDRPARLPVLLAFWTLLLVLGFAVVLTLGAPLPNAEDEVAAAMAPRTPVTEDIARQSAETIVRLQYPEFVGVTPTISRRTDFEIERYVIVYSDPVQGAGLRISITIEAGKVDVSSFN
jgi:hypothetical protein